MKTTFGIVSGAVLGGLVAVAVIAFVTLMGALLIIVLPVAWRLFLGGSPLFTASLVAFFVLVGAAVGGVLAHADA